VAAWCHRELAELRLNLPTDAPQMGAFLAKLWESGNWELEVGREAVRRER